MGVYVPEMPCCFCGKPLGYDEEQLIGFPAWLSSNPLILELNDAVLHRRCLSQWEKRDNFVKAYNQAAGRKHPQLKIDWKGQVRYKKRSPSFALMLIRMFIRGFFAPVLRLFEKKKTCRPVTPCPFCDRPLRTNRAKQCPHCGADWHDPQDIKKFPMR